jgi:hypothetical protein
MLRKTQEEGKRPAEQKYMSVCRQGVLGNERAAPKCYGMMRMLVFGNVQRTFFA